MGEFSGFKRETIEFLRGLEANNSKLWFDENRAAYDAHYIAPAKDFVAAIGPHLRSLAPKLNAEPRVNGSIFRVNRDIRFSKDKTPYKPHIDLWFWEGERKIASSGLFFRLAPGGLILGAGAHGFPPDALKKYRSAVAGKAGDRLIKLEKEFAADDLELRGEHYKKLPREYDTDNEDRARFLRHKALFTTIEMGHPKSLGTPDFVDFCADQFARVLPLHVWLTDCL